MRNNALRLISLIATLSGPAIAQSGDLPSPELINAHGESYVNLQLCSNTYLEYRNRPEVAQRFLDASLEIQSAYASDEQLDGFIDAIQRAHDKQADIQVHRNESREQFYQRVFSETRCEEELETAQTWAAQ